MQDSADRWDLTWHWESRSALVDDAWSKLGITCVTKAAGGNAYFYQGEQISRKQAYDIAMGELPHPCGMSGAHFLWVWLLRSVEVTSLEPDEHSLRLPVMLKGGHTPAIPFSTDAY